VAAQDPLQEVPGVGPRICVVLRELVIASMSGLKGRDPLLLYDRLRELNMAQPSLRLDIRRRPWMKRRKSGEGVRSVTVRTTGVIDSTTTCF